MDKYQTVLIVEDDPNDAFFIRRAFQKSGVTRLPHICPNVPDAIRYLEGSGEYVDRGLFPFPNLLVSDIKMPGASGFDLLRWIRAHPHIQIVPIVVMSSSYQREDVKCAYCLGANAYLCKPGDSDGFNSVFAKLLDFWAICEVPDIDAPTCTDLLEDRQLGHPLGVKA
jgi:CheY-like chemotaxis protein